jgi:hypothetical protein
MDMMEITEEQMKRAVEQTRAARKRLAEKRARESLAAYWNGSISAGVMADYKNGNVKTIHC